MYYFKYFIIYLKPIYYFIFSYCLSNVLHKLFELNKLLIKWVIKKKNQFNIITLLLNDKSYKLLSTKKISNLY